MHRKLLLINLHIYGICYLKKVKIGKQIKVQERRVIKVNCDKSIQRNTRQSPQIMLYINVLTIYFNDIMYIKHVVDFLT